MPLPEIGKPLPVKDILQQLVTEARQRINATPVPKGPIKRRAPVRVLAWYRQYKQADRVKRRLETKIRRAGFYYSSTFLQPIDSKDARKTAYEKAQQARRNKLADVELAARLDLLSLTRPRAKAYFLQLRKKLQAL